ncbi:AAA family ATPase [Methylocystis hirsuta]|uniref:AAA family ATPase n=1 Tax=Methylocystis hirsuta TaxID=369798 RepID=UPI001AECE174|nr:AAA family ATPase [Methylocystis hirsuta]
MTRASTLKAEPVDWFWRGWLARGKLHIIGGQPGAGKTTLAMLMASTATIAGLWPDGSRAPQGNVIIWSGEDDPADTLLPRLLASGADVERVFFVGDVAHGEERRPFDPAKDMEPLREAIEKAGGCVLIVVDPIVSAVAGDSHKNADTRRALQPLVDLAASVDAALLGITHLSKGTSGREPIERITGSIAFGALARVVMIAAKEGETEDGTPPRRFLARAKSNIGPDEGGFAYELRQEPMPGDNRIIASIAAFGEAIEGTARAMLATAETNTEEDCGSALREAKDFLKDFLAHGSKPVKGIECAGRDAGHSPRTLRRAKDALGIASVKSGLTGGWEWTLPEGGQDGQDFEAGHLQQPNEKVATLATLAVLDAFDNTNGLGDGGLATFDGAHDKPGGDDDEGVEI